MECIDGKSWQLAPPKEFSIRSAQQLQEINSQFSTNPNYKMPPAPPITLVSHSPNCADMAIVDDQGNLSIVVTGVTKPTGPSRLPLLASSLNELEIVYSDASPSNTEIVALQWLPMNKPSINSGPATRISTQADPLPNGAASQDGAAFDDAMHQAYQYNISQQKPVGPAHPISSKQACIAIREDGQIDLWYQGEHGLDYNRVTRRLDLNNGADMNITKASIGFSKDDAVIAAVYDSATGFLDVVSITVDWGYLVYAAQMQKKMPHFVTAEGNRAAITYSIKKLARAKLDKIDANTGEYQILRILEVISPSSLGGSNPEIFLGFETKDNNKFFTCIHALEIETEPISSLFPGSTPGSKFSGTCLKTKEVINCPELLISLRPSVYNTFLLLCYQSGVVRTYDRAALKQIENLFKEDKQSMSFNNPSTLDQYSLELPKALSSLADAGFEFPAAGFSPLFTQISPSLCSYVAMDPSTGSLVWRNIKRDPELMAAKDRKAMKKGFLILSASAFAFTHTFACFTQCFTGDLITTIQLEFSRVRRIAGPDYAEKFIIAIMEECQRSINFQLDYTRENADKLLNHPPFQKLLSLQLALGTSIDWQRNKSSRMASYLLHLRLGALIITLSLRTIFHQIQKENSGNRANQLDETYIKSNTLISAIGFVNWFVDFCVMLNKQLIEIGEKLADSQENLMDVIEDYIVIPLLMTNVSRSLVLYSIAGIRKLNEYSIKSMENIDLKNYKNLPIAESFERLSSVITSAPIRLDVFEKFVSDTDNSIRNMKHDKVTTIRIETALFIQAKIPRSYAEPIRKLCTLYAAMAKKDFDLLSLYFYDVDWLDCNKSVGSAGSTSTASQDAVIQPTTRDNHEMLLSFKKRSNSLLVDELRKNLIISRNLRRCVLCGSVSSCEEIPLYNVDILSPTTLPFQRSCFCGGYWVSF